MSQSIMVPDYKFKRVWDIDVNFLKELEMSFLIIDIDNTLALADDPIPQNGAEEWILDLKTEGFEIIFLSNNTESRVKPFADIFNLPYIHMGLKPLSFKFKKAMRMFKKTQEETAIIGDQIFTDILGGNLAKITTILVEPFEPKTEGGFFFRLKRRMERRYIALYDKEHREG